jgi:hypothetical protein
MQLVLLAWQHLDIGKRRNIRNNIPNFGVIFGMAFQILRHNLEYTTKISTFEFNRSILGL